MGWRVGLVILFMRCSALFFSPPLITFLFWHVYAICTITHHWCQNVIDFGLHLAQFDLGWFNFVDLHFISCAFVSHSFGGIFCICLFRVWSDVTGSRFSLVCVWFSLGFISFAFLTPPTVDLRCNKRRGLPLKLIMKGNWQKSARSHKILRKNCEQLVHKYIASTQIHCFNTNTLPSLAQESVASTRIITIAFTRIGRLNENNYHRLHKNAVLSRHKVFCHETADCVNKQWLCKNQLVHKNPSQDLAGTHLLRRESIAPTWIWSQNCKMELREEVLVASASVVPSVPYE